MKKTLIALSLLAAFAVNAQTTVDSTSGSASNAGAASQSGAAINAANSGNVTATGNENASRSDSASVSGARSGSSSGALGNVINLDQSVPSTQTINTSVSGTTNNNSTNRTTVDGTTTSNDNVKYSGVVENRASGGYTNTTNENINYSGTTTVKNVPSIAMSGPASGPCTGASGGLGLAGPGWGLGLNGSSVMADCRLRENARVLGMAMQSVDSAANPQEKGELMVMFMDAARGLAAYNNQIISQEVKKDAK